ncbi:TIGR-Tas system RNA-guided endonuclease [Jiangella alkaliphila]|uniref:Uncharacterized protein n=1 Tax=Jiangella alkaliphila TaxID=419479 RepID=A0A1H2IE16_9ACTN|nr:hypothetical protein [Jiangella alkaliphila]SDU42387.1 hypothetical protein SAMN04488563_1645 [Jiangella alkaliphila]
MVDLADRTLQLLADVLDDLERTRVANEARLRQLTRTDADSDGLERGFGLDLAHPDVQRLAGIVDAIAQLEHQATLNVQRQLRTHPLGSWAAAQRGVGEKQAARLLAAVGDPYWNDLHDRPRTVGELWQYCGHGDPARSRKRRGSPIEHSPEAKTRVHLVALSMLKAGNRAAYDDRRAVTFDRTHREPCVRCGPSGKPAPAGSEWSLGHRHADALRVLGKQGLLLPLWLAAREIHDVGP